MEATQEVKQAHQELTEALKIQVDSLQSMCQALDKIFGSQQETLTLGDVTIAGLS
jgi:hypothetical protein